VEVIDLIGANEISAVAQAAKSCLARHPGPAPAFAPESLVNPMRGYLPAHMTPDPEGFFVVYADHLRRSICLEHYRNDGLLDTVITGAAAAELYIPAIEKGLASRLDHAAYLGRELARAEEALHTGAPYVQDAAPEQQLKATSSRCSCAGAIDYYFKGTRAS
jgi:tetrahydromethanopterin S-methyltransferase subunit A